MTFLQKQFLTIWRKENLLGPPFGLCTDLLATICFKHSLEKVQSHPVSIFGVGTFVLDDFVLSSLSLSSKDKDKTWKRLQWTKHSPYHSHDIWTMPVLSNSKIGHLVTYVALIFNFCKVWQMVTEIFYFRYSMRGHILLEIIFYCRWSSFEEFFNIGFVR